MTRSRYRSVQVLLTVLCAAVAPAQVDFTTIDYPGAAGTVAYGINSAGEVVGAYYLMPYLWHAFKYSGGQFTSFDYPAAKVTLAAGINDSGLIVGYYTTGQGVVTYGYTYDGETFTSIRHGSDTITIAEGVNNAGQIVGGTGTSISQTGFLLTSGQFTLVEPPGKQQNYVFASSNGVNNLGDVAGDVILVTSDAGGFQYSAGRFRKLDYPGAVSTEVYGINDSGFIVGGYSVIHYGPESGFATKDGKFKPVNYPSATTTVCTGINDSGQIVGDYRDSNGAYHGFITSPIRAEEFK